MPSRAGAVPLSLVALVATSEPGAADFGHLLDLAGLAGLVQPGSRVLFKPNQHGGEGYTSAAVIRAGVQWAFAQGAASVVVGDGPFWGHKNPMGYFEQTGLLQVCRETGATPVDFHAGEYHVLETHSPDLPPTIGFSQHLLEADVVINLPVMKTHFNTLVTLGVKNLKGCLRQIDKKTLHELELNAALASVARLLKPWISATVLDATTAYEGMGPSAATPVPMNLLLASSDVAAVDSVACDLMGIDPASARLLRACAERGVGETDLARIRTVGASPRDHRRRLALPYEALAASFPDLTVLTEHACSGCVMNLFRALEMAHQQGKTVLVDCILAGPEPALNRPALHLGKCAGSPGDGGRAVRGCPPRVEDILHALTSPSL